MNDEKRAGFYEENHTGQTNSSSPLLKKYFYMWHAVVCAVTVYIPTSIWTAAFLIAIASDIVLQGRPPLYSYLHHTHTVHHRSTYTYEFQLIGT